MEFLIARFRSFILLHKKVKNISIIIIPWTLFKDTCFISKLQLKIITVLWTCFAMKQYRLQMLGLVKLIDNIVCSKVSEHGLIGERFHLAIYLRYWRYFSTVSEICKYDGSVNKILRNISLIWFCFAARKSNLPFEFECVL